MRQMMFQKQREELIGGIGRGEFNDPEQIPERYTYAHLLSVFEGADLLEGGRELYRQIYGIVTQCALSHLKKVSGERKIRVTFLTFSAAEWQAESVYRKLAADNRFDVRIVVTVTQNRMPEARRQTFEETMRFFTAHGYPVVTGYDPATDISAGWTELGELPDIVFHLSSWYSSMPMGSSLVSLPLRCLNFYLPYCMFIPENPEHTYLRDAVYNIDFVNAMYRVYTDSRENLEGYRTEEVLGGSNVIYTGFPKMDRFFEERPPYAFSQLSSMWKQPPAASVYKRVIIAPHHSIAPEHPLHFGTFHLNAQLLLQLAKDYGDRISFVLKPHPHTRATAVSEKVFESFDAYDAYLDEWSTLPNARVVTEDDYLELFATSDAMIMDSGSFIGEYLYVNKPLLFLTREGQAFGALGERLIAAHYKAPATDEAVIRNFLDRVVLGGEDEMENTRKQIFSECLNYPRHNGCLAGETIYDEVKRLLTD